jgi:hypothetical protein
MIASPRCSTPTPTESTDKRQGLEVDHAESRLGCLSIGRDAREVITLIYQALGCSFCFCFRSSSFAAACYQKTRESA